MNAVRRESSYEVRMVNTEATDTKIDALRDSQEETKADVRELRKDSVSLREKVDDLRAEMHAGFTALRGEMHAGLAAIRDEMSTGLTAIRGEMNTGLTAIRGEMNTGFTAIRSEMNAGVNSLRESVAELRAMIKTMVWGVAIVISLCMGFLTAGKVLHWF